jgi:hypothetical protein
MSAVKPSLYETLIIESTDQSKTIDIRLGTVSIDYYEDIFSPTITAKIRVVNTGDTIVNDGEWQSVYNGLPLRGGERILMKIGGNTDLNPGLDFSARVEDYFYVSSITEVVSKSQNESFVLNLVSREAITNETSRVVKKYPVSLSIDDSVRDILGEYLKTNKIGRIDESQNTYGFIGNMRKPFTILVWLASKAVPDISGDATAGFLFYQTKDGFQFRSIDKLIMEQPRAEYFYSEVNQSSFFANTDFKILKYSTNKNQDLLEKLRLGTYSSYRMFYDPHTFNFTSPEQGVFKTSDYRNKVKNLGKKLSLPELPAATGGSTALGDTPTRILTQIMDVGTLENQVSEDVNSDPMMYQSQALMRYNILFTQNLNMTIPLNTNLRAGDIIKCNFPKISNSDTNEYDDEQSGLYMIKELCHHFDAQGSYTSMKLIRDTFGLYGANNR